MFRIGLQSIQEKHTVSSRDYQRLHIEEFGRQLITSGDLDPIYIALHRQGMSREQLHRWLLAYWCFYHAGFASYAAERELEHYWQVMENAARNTTVIIAPTATPAECGVNGQWPRGKERRHFRGQQGIKAIAELQATFGCPEYAVVDIAQEAFRTFPMTLDDGTADYGVESFTPKKIPAIPYNVLVKRVKAWRGFGTWISYKVGDMLDRCAGIPIDFGFDDAMYDEPHKAAIMQWKIWHGAPQVSTVDDEKAAVKEVVERLLTEYKDLRAAPYNDRPIGLTEIETVLCKWKSHMGGHYPLWNDIDEIREGLAPWAKHSVIAAGHLECMPKRNDKSV